MTRTGRYATLMRAYRRHVILAALAETRGNRTQAATVLGIGRPYLHRLIKELAIVWAPPPDARA